MSVPCPTGHVICPYNKSHVIRTERIQFHLTKCLPNAGDRQFVVCPFNSTHLIPASEINNHKTNLCPDRILLDTFLYDVSGSKPLFEVNKIEVECEENWDDETGYSYNPEEVLNEKKLLVLKQCVPPAERKRFHAEQRKKFQSMPDDPSISVSKNNNLKIRAPNSKSIAETGPAKTEVKVVENKMEKFNINEIEHDKKPNDEFELVVGKKKNKKTNQKEAVKPINSETKKKEQKVVKKQPIKNTIENVKVAKEEPKNEGIKENITVEPKEDEFIVVTKKKNKSRKH